MREYILILLMLAFLTAWTYTEVVELEERRQKSRESESFVAEVHEFMSSGDRFTKQRGDALESRLEAVEEVVLETNNAPD